MTEIDLIAREADNAAEFDALCVEFPRIPDRMRREIAGLPYSTLCPECGGLLLAVEDQPDTAPWLCDRCHRGFWSAELSDQPREAIDLEQMEAQWRACSLRPDQLRLLTAEELAVVPGRRPGLHPDFRAAIAAEIERKGRAAPFEKDLGIGE